MQMKLFYKIECGEGTHPLCQFWLNEPIEAGILGNIERVDLKLADDDKMFHVWVISKEKGRVYYKLVRNKVPSEAAKRIGDCVLEALNIATIKTRENREGMKKPSEMLRESVRKIVSEYVKTKILNENSTLFQTLEGDFAVIVYLELFNEYVVRHGDKCYRNEKTGKYQEGGVWHSFKKRFSNINDAENFCNRNGLEVIDTIKVSHSLGKGLPDTRAISDTMSRDI